MRIYTFIVIFNYGGYSNENSMIRADIDFSNDVIITGSENGFCYTWKILAEDEKYLKRIKSKKLKLSPKKPKGSIKSKRKQLRNFQ